MPITLLCFAFALLCFALQPVPISTDKIQKAEKNVSELVCQRVDVLASWLLGLSAS